MELILVAHSTKQKFRVMKRWSAKKEGWGAEGRREIFRVCQQQTLESVRSRGEPWGKGPTSCWNEQQKHPQLKKTFIHKLKYSLIAEGESPSEMSDKKLFPTGQPPLRHLLIPGNLVCVNGYNGHRTQIFIGSGWWAAEGKLRSDWRWKT